jgi:hypothetical protein
LSALNEILPLSKIKQSRPMNTVHAFSHTRSYHGLSTCLGVIIHDQKERTLKKTKKLKRTNKSGCFNILPSKIVFVCYGFEILEDPIDHFCLFMTTYNYGNNRWNGVVNVQERLNLLRQ